MKLRNRLTALALAGVMCAGYAAPLTVSAGEEVVIDGITYYVQNDATPPYAYIYKCDPSVTNVDIPSTVNGVPVQFYNLFDGVFKNCTSLTSVTFHDCSLGRLLTSTSFHGCTALQTVTIEGDRGFVYRDDAFYRNNCLYTYVHNCGETSYTVPDDVAYLGKYAFWDPGALTDLTILNPDCYIPDTHECIASNVTIHGYDDSTAYRYAMVYGNRFVSLGKSMTSPSAQPVGASYAPADLNGDGSVNAPDATIILMYAAYVGAGGTDDIMTFVAEQ